MSFAFSFADGDIDGAQEPAEQEVSLKEKISTDAGLQVPVTLQELTSESPDALLSCLPSSINYDLLPIALDDGTRNQSKRRQVVLARRSMFDIKAQLMAEADFSRNDNHQLLSAINKSDLTQGTYEGGLKIWEGALDLGKLLLRGDILKEGHISHVIELGAGSALPSIIALTKVLQLSGGLRCVFTICDYNKDVLHLATVPNILIATTLAKVASEAPGAPSMEGCLEVDQAVVSECIAAWEERGIQIRLVSGPWGKELEAAILGTDDVSGDNLLLLASETIYELSSLAAFTELVLNLLRRHGDDSRAWIAAKRVYFGVGGGVAEFCRVLRTMGGKVAEIMEIDDQGVARVVLEITVSRGL